MAYPTTSSSACLRALFLILLLAAPVLHSADRQPNIIFMMGDDVGWRDLGCYGSELHQTPHLDALAERGVRFSNAYSASPLCSPTRASILTGQTPGRLRLTVPAGHLPEVVLDPVVPETGAVGLPMTNPQTRTRLPLDSQSIARILKAGGYRTGFMGKWHLGFDPYIPENFGFDVVVGGRGFPGPPPPGFFGPWDPEVTNMPLVEGPLHADDVIGDEAVRFIRESRDEPFFLALWFFDVHAPFVGKEELVEKYRPLTEKTVHQKSAIMGAMMETLDDNVGKVMAVLDELGLREDTIVIFTSDNGGNMYNRPEGVNPTSNHPLRAGKGNNHEGGSRVPLIVSWPGQAAEKTVSETIAVSYDFYPTLLEMVGLEAPEDALLDGVSLMESLDGSTLERPPIYSMFGHTVLATGNISNVWARDGQWKLFRFFHAGPDFEDTYELYNLVTDPGETVDLATEHPAVVSRLSAFLEERLRTDGVLVPKQNPRYDPNLAVNGWRIVSGGFFTGASDSPRLNVTSPGESVTLRYSPPTEGPHGTRLRLQVSTNCAVSAVAGWGAAPLFGTPASVVPDLQQHEVVIPLDDSVSADFITVVFELEQPGRLHVLAAEMM
ncbi:MAG: sulfatase [Puniceicoccaceae bacterium]